MPNLPVLFLWSDSQIALHWNKSQKPNPVFIQNHINSLLPTAIWNCSPSVNNPAQEVLLLPHYLYHHTYHNMDPLHQTIAITSTTTITTTGLSSSSGNRVHTHGTSTTRSCVISIDHHGSLIKLLSVTVCVYHFNHSKGLVDRLLQNNFNGWISTRSKTHNNQPIERKSTTCWYQHSSLKQLEFYLFDNFDCS